MRAYEMNMLTSQTYLIQQFFINNNIHVRCQAYDFFTNIAFLEEICSHQMATAIVSFIDLISSLTVDSLKIKLASFLYLYIIKPLFIFLGTYTDVHVSLRGLTLQMKCILLRIANGKWNC